MSLPLTPIMKKFFSNKIESSKAEWGDYLLEIADIFSVFDGEELDRDLLSERFSTISGRSPYALRDISNFRDEFGAYGTYLGLFQYKKFNNKWHIVLSKATKHFLCSTEPDVESFCRTQLALFQYPNGAGAVPGNNGRTTIQANVRIDTVREIQNNIRINPLRLLCRVVITMHKYNGVPLNEIVIPYKTIFMLFNDDSINQTFSPSFENIQTALREYENCDLPSWVIGHDLTNFKRNFHVFERIGIFKRVQSQGLALLTDNAEKVYSYIETIGTMTNDFLGFEPCYNQPNIEENVKSVISSSAWGDYFDSLNMSTAVLNELSYNYASTEEFLDFEVIINEHDENRFPRLREYQTEQVRAFVPSGNIADPFETIVRREKANREHSRILNMLAAIIRTQGYEVYENTFIDLYSNINDLTYIFEIKSNNSKNTLSQIRKAVSQLYEYRYRCQQDNAILCLVMQEKPSQDWVIDYLIKDRNINICWLVDDVRLECPNDCRDILSNIGIIE